MRVGLAIFAGLLPWSRASAAEEQIVDLGSFEKGTDNFEGDLTRLSDGGGEGTGYLRLCNGEQNFVEMGRRLALRQDFLEFRFMARGDSTDHVGVRFTDATGQEFLHRLPLPPDRTWHELTIREFGVGETWGGAADKKWHPPCRGVTFVLENKKATIDIDGVRARLAGEIIARDLAWLPGQASNVFLSGEEATIPFESAAEVVDFRVTDFWGKDVASVTVRPARGLGVLHAPAQDGYFLVRARAMRAGGVLAERYTSYAVVPPHRTPDPDSSPWGVATHFAQGMNPGIIPTLKRAGIGMIRDEMYWEEVETERGRYAFKDQFARYMDAAREAGIAPLLLMTFANRLYDEGKTPWTDGGCDAFGEYGRAILDRFGDQVRWLEVWNEYNGTWCEGPAASDRPKSYVKLLRNAYAKIKAKEPRVAVLGGAAVLLPLPYFEGIFRNGGLELMDGIVIHPYRARPEGVDEEVEALRETMRRFGGGKEKDIWVTETGLATTEEFEWERGRHLYEKGRAMAARYLPRQFALLLKAGCKRIFWYLCSDHHDFVAMGLLRGGDEPGGTGPYAVAAPYVAYATLIRQLDAKAFVRREGFHEYSRAHCYLFGDGDDAVRVCWATEPATLQLSADGPLRVIDLMGGERTLSPREGKIQLQLGEEVQYVRGPVRKAEVSDDGKRCLAGSHEDYGPEQGKKSWRYGYREGLGGDFRPMGWGMTEWEYRWLAEGHPFLHHSRDGGEPEGNAAAPTYLDRRWSSPIDGRAILTGRIGCDDKRSDGIDAHILVDGKEVFSKTISGGTAEPISVPVSLRAGGTVDFLIGPNRETAYDACTLDLRVMKE